MSFRHILQFVAVLGVLTWSASPRPALAQHGGHAPDGFGHHGGSYYAGSSHHGGVGYYGGFGHYRGYGHYGLSHLDGSSYGYYGWPAYRGYGYSSSGGDVYGLGAYPGYLYRRHGPCPYYHSRRLGFRYWGW